MTTGRTSWWPKDAAFHRRELIVELGEEFAAEGPNVVDVLCAWAQEQRAAGVVRGGFRTLAREAFVTVSHAQSILARAGEIGVLDDLECDADGRRFTCRISGWKSDQDRGRAAVRQADKRNQPVDSPEHTVTDRDDARSVTDNALPNHTTPEVKSVEDARASDIDAKVTAVVDVLLQCSRLHVDRLGVENAVAAWPNCDPLRAAHEAVAWATDPTYTLTNGARVLASALSKQQQRQQQPQKAYAGAARSSGPPPDEYAQIARDEA